MTFARRRFLHSLAALPLVPAFGDTPDVAPSPAPAPTPSPVPSPPTTAEATASALGRVIEARYGAHFEGTGDLGAVTKTIRDALEGAERMRKLPLTNADEPVTAFAARPPAAQPGVTPRDAR
jgi:hypothetical protein